MTAPVTPTAPLPGAAPAAPAAAPRLRAPSWRDPRLVVGVLLVLASVLLGAWVVSARDRTEAVWAASSTLAPGDQVGRDALTTVRVHLGRRDAHYLLAARPLPAHLVALRVVGSGELVPRSAVGSAARLHRRPVGLSVVGPLASGIVKGAAVDVWTSMPRTGSARTSATGSSAYDPPQLLTSGAEVFEVSGPRSGLGADGSATTVQVLLAPGPLQRALAAQAAGARTALVLLPGSTPAER